MDQLNEYRRLIKHLLDTHLQWAQRSPAPGVETVLVCDAEHDEYILRDVGWSQRYRVRNTLLHVRIRNGKIWIEEDWTEEGFATDLLRAGVPKDDIVLAFHPPEMRQYTEFAIA
jgi:hypothetical protein